MIIEENRAVTGRPNSISVCLLRDDLIYLCVLVTES